MRTSHEARFSRVVEPSASAAAKASALGTAVVLGRRRRRRVGRRCRRVGDFIVLDCRDDEAAGFVLLGFISWMDAAWMISRETSSEKRWRA